MQSDVTLSDGTISGNLKYVTDYSGYSTKVEYQTGNYLALEIKDASSSSIKVELTDDGYGPVTLDNTGIWVGRITDPDNQYVEIEIESGVYRYKLSGLTLAK